ncbi:MAG: TetR/AcrR family transcriptional regulator [Thiohalophilus sp.]
MGKLSEKVARGRETRDALIAAGREEFATNGYADSAVDAIVRRAGVTKGAFYHHFSGKEDLFGQVFEHVKKELSRAAFVVHADHEPFAPRGAERTRLEQFATQTNTEVWREFVGRCRRYIELHLDPRVRRIALIDARSVLPWQEWQRVEREHGVTMLRADLRRATHRGIIRALPLNVLATVVVGALNEACMLVANSSNPEDVLDQAMSVIECMLDGLLIDGTEPPSGEHEPLDHGH